MIISTITDKGITLTGHAGYAPRGQDIVCACVSAIWQTFTACCEGEVMDATDIHTYEKPKEETERENTLFEALVTGLELVAGAYPNHIRIIKKDAKA